MRARLGVVRHQVEGREDLSGLVEFPQKLSDSPPFAAPPRTNGYGRKRNFPDSDQLH